MKDIMWMLLTIGGCAYMYTGNRDMAFIAFALSAILMYTK